jgi:hypothetical protein
MTRQPMLLICSIATSSLYSTERKKSDLVIYTMQSSYSSFL